MASNLQLSLLLIFMGRMANEFGFLVDGRNGLLPPDTSKTDGKRPRSVAHFSTGCMRGIYGTGVAIALFEQGLFQQFDGYSGSSVGAVISAFVEDPVRGLPIFRKLIEDFIKLPKGDVCLPYTGHVVMSEEIYITAGLLVTALRSTSVIERFLGKGSTYINQAHLLKILLEEVIPDIDAIKRSPKERIIYYTDAETGLPVAYDMRQAKDLKDLVTRIDASSHVPVMSGNGVIVDGRMCFDGCFSASYPVSDLAKRGYTHILLLLNEHPDHMARGDAVMAGLAKLFYGRNTSSPGLKAIQKYMGSATDLLKALLNEETVVDGHPIHVRAIHPDRDDPILKPTETDPSRLDENFRLGYTQGKIFAASILREWQEEITHARPGSFMRRVNDALDLSPHARHPSLLSPRVA